MFNHFKLNDKNMSIVEDIGRYMPGGFFIYKAQGDGELLYANHTVFDIFGCRDLDEFKSLTGFTFKGMVYTEDYEKIQSSIDKQILKSSEKLDYVEYRIKRKDGKLRWVDDYGHYADSENYGGLYYVFISDITEKHEQIEQKLLEGQKQRAQLDSMITAMASDYRSVYHVDLDKDDAVCYRGDPEDHHQHAEGVHFPYLERFRDYGNNCVTEKYREGFLNFIEPANVREALQNEQLIAYRYLARRDGKEYYEMIRMAGVHHPEDRKDHMVHAVGMGLTIIDAEMRDSMAKNQALGEALDAAEEASKAKTAFLSNMSHEIRTPMNAIIGLNSLALRDPTISERTREYLEKIGGSARHLLTLINDILEMSRIESGKVELEFSPEDLCKIFESIRDLFAEQMKQKKINFQLHLSQVKNNLVWCDKKNLNRVLLNVLSNAFKFTPERGSVNVSLWEVGAGEEGYGFYEIRIQDTGIGMSKDFVGKIFTAFERERSSTNSRTEGTGLGLAITKSIVDMMGGTIEVLTSLGNGTEIIIRVKFKLATEEDLLKYGGNKPEESDESATSEVSFAGKRALLVEDNLVNLEIAKMILLQTGFAVETAENGKAAVKMVEKSAPGYYDLILMDIQMPVMDGYTATKNIRLLENKALAQIPIVAMTANAFAEDVKAAEDAGMQAHIAKPVDVKTMIKTLARVLDGRKA